MSADRRQTALWRAAQRLPPGLKKAIKLVVRPSYAAALPGKPTYCEDGLATIHSCEFCDDPEFSAAYAKGRETGSWDGIRWRAHVYSWVATQAFLLPGDFVECGVNLGGYARMTFEYIPLSQSEKKFYLLDTFNGFDAGLLCDEEVARGIPQAYDYRECYEQVRKTFSAFPNAVLIRGRVPDTLERVPSKEIAFLSIDMNCAEPEIAAIEHFWPKLVKGGFVLLDDFGHPRHAAQKRAFDAFAKRKSIRILYLPTEQGLIIKP